MWEQENMVVVKERFPSKLFLVEHIKTENSWSFKK